MNATTIAARRADDVAHATFTIERRYPDAPGRVWKALIEHEARLRWFFGGEGWELLSHEVDLRFGGWERSRFSFRGGPEITNDTVFLDIVDGERQVFAYQMTVAGKPISASLATIELFADGEGTRLAYTEQGAYFGDPAAAKNREEGCRDLFERLAKELRGEL